MAPVASRICDRKIIREEKLDKLYAISILVAVVVAIAAAFVSIPNAAAIMLVLGGIGALAFINAPDVRLRVYAATIVLVLAAKSLSAIPVAGDPLAAIFAGVAIVLTGASIVGITVAISQVIKTSLVK
ncbi:MAG TPA: hypothetical protein VFI23_10700 [Rhizomicrobium sp.]|nr:hypothetical protein [Rhizomicrobium sp.]